MVSRAGPMLETCPYKMAVAARMSDKTQAGWLRVVPFLC
jgi:hypothetical protein